MVLAGAFCLSVMAFLVLTKVSDTAIMGYVRNTHFLEKEQDRLIHSLQAFVKKNAIGPTSIARINEWKKSEKYVRVIFFRDKTPFYDSDWPEYYAAGTGENNTTVYSPNSSISLNGVSTPVYLDFFSEYKFYEFATAIQLLFSFIIFTGILVFFTSKHLSYINQIAFGIGILEGGNLEYEIPVRGTNELATLATSLNDMRKAFMKKNESITDNQQYGMENLSAISHDLRTPLTTLILFIEIIKTKKNITNEERDHYIQKLSVIANKIRVLSENLDDFTSEKNRYSAQLDNPQPMKNILDEVLSETIVFLKERNFTIIRRMRIKDEIVQVNNHFIYRIIDNVISNIDRYAAHDHPVVILAKRRRDSVCISFTNAIAPRTDSMETSKLGLTLVKEMMHKMNGTCTITNQANTFEISLAFPVINRTNVG
jgi:signal transduction histidine kinase